MTENTRSTTTPLPPSYSPASQRSRYSQPNLPTLMIPYSSDNSRSSASPTDRLRYRMSQPTLNSSFSGINFMGTMKGSKFSYTSLRTSGDGVSSNFQIKEDRLSTPNVHCFISETSTGPGNISTPRKFSGHHGYSPSRFFFGPSGKRERLSQPTLVTGDYYPGKVNVHHQRLSQPCLTTWNERPISLHSPIKQKRIGPLSTGKISQRDRLSVLDFGAKYHKNTKDSVKFRDRFSIPELESQNELKLIAGTPKQRFSLDSQLNPDGSRARRLLPIAPSPISEHQKDEKFIIAPSEALEGVIIASTTPLLPSAERQFLVPAIVQANSSNKPLLPPPPITISNRERMSVPEIRTSSLRRLLDPPTRQRHSIAVLRQNLLSIDRQQQEGDIETERVMLLEESIEEGANKTTLTIPESVVDEQAEVPSSCEIKTMPKHIQKHYSYTYDAKEDAKQVIGKLAAGRLKKKYLESNFDENEQVITTVIETEIPMILTSPKYMKKTHVYSSDPPKWMKKCLEEEKRLEETLRANHKTKTSPGKRKTSPGSTSPGKKKSKAIGAKEQKITSDQFKKDDQDIANKTKDTMVRIKSTGHLGENKYEVAVSSNISEVEICRLYGIQCESDSEDSTSV